jgi:hypothetical protein
MSWEMINLLQLWSFLWKFWRVFKFRTRWVGFIWRNVWWWDSEFSLGLMVVRSVYWRAPKWRLNPSQFNFLNKIEKIDISSHRTLTVSISSCNVCFISTHIIFCNKLKLKFSLFYFVKFENEKVKNLILKRLKNLFLLFMELFWVLYFLCILFSYKN